MSNDFVGLRALVSAVQAKRGKRFVVYTCITNGYSKAAPPPAPLLEDFDFLLFSDRPSEIPGWECIVFDPNLADPRRSAKCLKVLPSLFLSAYEVSVWIDGNVRLSLAFAGLVSRFLDAGASIGLFEHGRRACVYDEADECIRWGKDDPEVIERQVARYREEGHPLKWGLFMGGLIIRRHMRSDCHSLMMDWWSEINRGSVRDQLSLPVVLRRACVSVFRISHVEMGALVEIVPHEKFRSYAVSGRNLLNIRAVCAPIVYRLLTSRFIRALRSDKS